MKILFSTSATEPMKWTDVIDFARKIGVDGISFCNIIPHDNKLDIISTKLKNSNLEVEFHSTIVGVDLGCINEEIRKASVKVIKNNMLMSKKLNSKVFYYHLNYKPFGNGMIQKAS